MDITSPTFAQVIHDISIVRPRVLRFALSAGLLERIAGQPGLTVREAITNVLKHTQAISCSITICPESRGGRRGVSLVVADSGPGTLPSPGLPARQSGTGLITLRKRYRDLGGELDFRIDGGGQLTGWLPVGHGNGNGEN